MNTQDSIAVASRSFSKNNFLIASLKERYASIILNKSGKTLQGDELVKFLMPAHKAIIGIEAITDSLLSQLPNLHIISKYGVGLNNLDLKAMKARGIKLGFTAGVNKQSVAELALTLMLMGLRKIHGNNLDILNGNWSQEKGSELYGKTIGLLGFGNIGMKLAELIQPFKCNILFFDEREHTHQDIADIASELNLDSELIHQESLNTVLNESDILSIHLPLLPETENIISINELNQLKPNICIINTARGGVVNEDHLHSFLISNPNAFAGFDVYKEEPAFKNPLFALPNFFGTSHRSSLTNEGINSMGMAAINGLDDNIYIT